MGGQKYIRKIEELFKKSPVVDFSSIEKIVKEKKNIKQYTKQIIRNMIKRGKISILTKGHYTSRNETSLAVFCFKPSYLGLQDSLSSHNLWEQETIPIIITTRKIRQGIRKTQNTNILIRRIDKKYFFGIEYIRQNDLVFPYSDIEKTFIDMIYFNETMSDDTLSTLLKRINKTKLKEYLKNYPKRMQQKIMKYLI